VEKYCDGALRGLALPKAILSVIILAFFPGRKSMTPIEYELGVLMLDVQGLTLHPEEFEILQNPMVGGVILFSRNYSSPSQLQELVNAISECNPQLLIAVDQEGGRVQRFREGFVELPPLHAIGKRYFEDKPLALQLAREGGWLMASELLAVGIDFSFAPVMDLYDAGSKVIADRAFSDHPNAVAELASSYISGMHEAGMAATGKHFPGHGSIEADSHVELPVDHRSLQLLRDNDMVPFALCIDQLDAIMPAHVIYEDVAPECAGFSDFWLQDILRQELGFTGVIFSDDLTMAAAHSVGSVEIRAERALAAGCDMLLVCNDKVSAANVIQWLETENYPQSGKLSTMKARKAVDRSVLIADQQWQAARSSLDMLSA